LAMSNVVLSERVSQKLQQMHNMVLQFQALESELRDSFADMEASHQAEIRQYQNHINQLKGGSAADAEQMNSNQFFGASQLKHNPLAQQRGPSSSIAPQQQQQQRSANSTPHGSYRQSPVSMQQRPMRSANGSVAQKFNHAPSPVAPSPHSHTQSAWKKTNYAQHQPHAHSHTHASYHANKSRSNGHAPGPPPQYGLPQQQQQQQQPQGQGVQDKGDEDDDEEKAKEDADADKDKDENNGGGADAVELGAGISERDFYKKYWIEAGKIGEGAFARVRKITRKSDKAVFALKMIKKKGKSAEDIAALQREIEVLQKCDHSNVVRLGDWCDTKKRIYMVVEFCDGGDVFERVVEYKKFSERSAIHVVQQVASGLAHVHTLGFVHRDLKPDNLMYLTKERDAEIKIIDFGLAGDVSRAPYTCKTPCGTAHYAAPEVLSSLEYDQSADMWSLGVIIYTLLCGFPPFFDASNNMKNLYHLIKKGQYSFPSPFWDDISEQAKDLIRRLLLKDASARLSAKQVLTHEWIKSGATGTAPDKDLGNEYVKQMSHWQSTRQATEFGLGQEAPPPPPPDQPISLYYQQ